MDSEMKYLSKAYTAEERAEDLLQRLSLDEKMAQIVGFICQTVTSEQDVQKLKQMIPNGVGQISALPMAYIKNAEDVRKTQRILQTMTMEQSKYHIPAVFHNEGLCGASVIGGTVFASGIGRGASFDPLLEEKIGAVTARQELAFGFTQVLCPVLDIARDPRHGRFGEAYGEDPTHVAQMGTAHVRGQRSVEVSGQKVGTCAKHYMGYHLSQGGINTAHMEIGPRNIREVHGKPFQAAISKAGLPTVMPCYNASENGPVSSSKEMLTTILREEMGLSGIAISDYGAVANVHRRQHVCETMEEAGYKALCAGMDVELPMPVGFGAGLKQMFLDGRADMAVLDRAVKRVLTEKFKMGVFDQPFGASDEEFAQAYHQPEDEAISLASAREALVLLKNNGILPLKKKLKKIAIIGPQANWANYYFGGYSMLSGLETAAAAATSQAGFEQNSTSGKSAAIMIPGTNVQFCETEVFQELLNHYHPNCPSLFAYLKDMLPDTQLVYAHGYHIIGNNEDEFEEALKACAGADVILLTLGGKNASGTIATIGEGVDSADINLPACQDKFIAEASKLGIPMVGIHFDGRPISSDTADMCLDAILEAWNPGPYAAQAISEVLLGIVDPSGKMPVSTAYSAGQLPLYYNHPHGSAWHQGDGVGFQNYVGLTHEPRYPFGYGLSYTSFEYSELTINEIGDGKCQVAPNSMVSIRCKVRNVGAVKGTEVVQLYVSDPFATMPRPVQELAGFARVELEPGEAKWIEFALSPSQLAFLTEDMHWKIERGDISVMIGGSSVDQPLQGCFYIAEDAYVIGQKREFYAEASVIHS